MRPYLSIGQLAEVTPWTIEAIDAMVKRGQLQRGLHWFQPGGPRSARIFSWAAIQAYIEQGGAHTVPTPITRRTPEDVTREVSRRLAVG